MSEKLGLAYDQFKAIERGIIKVKDTDKCERCGSKDDVKEVWATEMELVKERLCGDCRDSKVEG